MGSFRTKRSFLLFSAGILLAAYIWLAFNWCCAEGEGVTVCLFKRITTLPCPGCGLTTALLLISEGDITNAFWTNPLSVLVFPLLVVSPFLLLFSPDWCYRRFCAVESYLSNGKDLYVLLFVIVVNWFYLIAHSI